jgi:hypothetical protein
MRLFVRSCALAVALSVASPALANECGSVRMPNQITVAGTPLVLNGMGIREATVFNVDVYVAGLYLVRRASDGNAIAASAEHKRLVLHFVRDVSRDDLVGAWNEGFRRNAGGSLGALQARINRLNGWMTAATSGMELTFTYIPGAGLRVHTGSTARGVIEGEDFARVFFSIWLGAHPPNAGLRRGLLGGSCD